MAELVVKYKWFIFAVILCWSFALAGRLYVENAHAADLVSFQHLSGSNYIASNASVVQGFTASTSNINKFSFISNKNSGSDTASYTVRILKGDTIAGSSVVASTSISFTCGFQSVQTVDFGTTRTYLNNKYWISFTPLATTTCQIYYREWENGYAGGSLYINSVEDADADLYMIAYYDSTDSFSDNIYDSVEIYDNPFFERHHLEVPALQYCANDNSQPCSINFSWNDRSWQSGVKLYNDNEDGTLGSYISSTTPLEFYPTLSGNISLPHTATTTEGYDYYCLRLYDSGISHQYPDEITCGIKVLFVSPSTITCAWEKARYEVENDEGKICEGIATSSAWEVGSWPGAMECAGKKISYWLFTASSSDYYSFCKATLATSERFPLNLVYSFKSKIFDLASSTRPATTTQVMLPLIWKGATTTTDLLPLASARAKGGAAFETLYTWLEIFIWLYAAWLIMSDLFGITLRTKERIANESYREAIQIKRH